MESLEVHCSDLKDELAQSRDRAKKEERLREDAEEELRSLQYELADLRAGPCNLTNVSSLLQTLSVSRRLSAPCSLLGSVACYLYLSLPLTASFCSPSCQPPSPPCFHPLFCTTALPLFPSRFPLFPERWCRPH